MVMSQAPITVERTINVPLERVWRLWTEVDHIRNWCHASDDWHAPEAENNVHVGGRFRTAMAARDGSAGFDFTGTYTQVLYRRLIEYRIDDGRKVSISFTPLGLQTRLVETFDPEDVNPREMQEAGWRAILENFGVYAEAQQK